MTTERVPVVRGAQPYTGGILLARPRVGGLWLDDSVSPPVLYECTSLDPLTWEAVGASGEGGAHPNLASHDTLGLATQAELDAVAAAKADVHSHPYAATSHGHLDGDIPATIARDTEVAAAYSPLGHSHGGGSSPWTTLIKTTDQANNTATLADDSVLQFATSPNTQYVIRLLAFGLTNATADMKCRFVHTGTTTRVRRRVKRTATTDIAQTIELKTAFDTADVVLSTTGANPWVEEDVIVQVGGSGGVLKLQFAQVTANAGPTQILEGSRLEYAVA